MSQRPLLLVIAYGVLAGCASDDYGTLKMTATAGTTAPILQMGTYLGGTGSEDVGAVAAGPGGTCVIAGSWRIQLIERFSDDRRRSLRSVERHVLR